MMRWSVELHALRWYVIFLESNIQYNIFLEFALQPQKESHYLVLMKQLYNLDYELSAEESVLINFGRLITLVFFIGIKIIL